MVYSRGLPIPKIAFKLVIIGILVGPDRHPRKITIRERLIKR
jgi:hypothetical protein